jgi:hypothetical protein
MADLVGESRNDSETSERARQLYEENVAPHLTEEDAEKFITIHLETGEYEIDADFDRVIHRAAERFGGGQKLFTVKAGFRPTSSLRIRPFKPGEKEWLLAKLTQTVK